MTIRFLHLSKNSPPGSARSKFFTARLLPAILVSAALLFAIPHAGARERAKGQYGAGLIVNVPFPENEVTQVVQEVVQSGIIRGTKEYNKDEYITGAESAPSSRVFPERIESGKVFYKIRFKAIDPRNFKDSGDVGTLAVRYVVQSQDNTHTVLRIDARYVEDFRHISHPSDGSVEGAEYKDIHDRLDQVELMKAEAAEAAKARPTAQARVTPPQVPSVAIQQIAPQPAPIAAAVPEQTEPEPIATASPMPETVEQEIHDLRRQVERTVKAPGAPLKSAPFHSATSLHVLPTGSEVLIVISTPYWVGVETHDGQHGWMLRDDLEQIP